MKRAQATAEYLILLSLVLIFLGLILFFFLDIPNSLDSFKRDRNSIYWEMEDIGVFGHAYNGSHLKLIIKNNLDYSINVTNISLNDIYLSESSVLLEPMAHDTMFLNPGSSVLDDSYSFKIVFNYVNLRNGASYILTGLSSIEGSVSSFN